MQHFKLHDIGLLLLSHFSHVRLCATPQTAARQAPTSLGFSRQAHWSGLPFPSPMHESEKMKVKLVSRVRLLATPWTAAHQAPPSMGFSRQEYWSGVPLPSPIGLLLPFKGDKNKVQDGEVSCQWHSWEDVILRSQPAFLKILSRLIQEAKLSSNVLSILKYPQMPTAVSPFQSLY